MSISKPSEFWIEQFNGRKPPSFYAFKDKPSFNKLMLKIDDAEVKACEYFHVIEASYAKELEAEIERLKAENAKLHTITNNLSTYSNLRKEENERLKSERDAAVEALRFYANKDNWGMIHNEPTEDGGEEDIGARIDYDDVCRDEHDNNFMCAGEKARAVLAMIDKGEKK